MKITDRMATSDGLTLEMVDIGLTKREYFALEILKVLLARGDKSFTNHVLVGMAVDLSNTLQDTLSVPFEEIK